MSTTLKTQKREKVGTRGARALRAHGRIPASLQATADAPHLDLSIDADEFMASRRHHQHLYELDIDGRVETALVRELQWDVYGDSLLHVEFRRVDRTRSTEVEVELEFVGRPKAGLLNQLVGHLTVTTRPDNIPDTLEVHVAELGVGTTVLARDARLPEGVTLAMPGDTPIARISAVKIQVEEAAPAPETAAAAPAAEGAAKPT
jgi:large subunit ribosomal protein L25